MSISWLAFSGKIRTWNWSEGWLIPGLCLWQLLLTLVLAPEDLQKGQLHLMGCLSGRGRREAKETTEVDDGLLAVESRTRGCPLRTRAGDGRPLGKHSSTKSGISTSNPSHQPLYPQTVSGKLSRLATVFFYFYSKTWHLMQIKIIFCAI